MARYLEWQVAPEQYTEGEDVIIYQSYQALERLLRVYQRKIQQNVFSIERAIWYPKTNRLFLLNELGTNQAYGSEIGSGSGSGSESESVHVGEEGEEGAEGVPIRIGDVLAYALNPFPIGYHHVLYLGQGMIANLTQHDSLRKRSVVIIERIESLIARRHKQQRGNTLSPMLPIPYRGLVNVERTADPMAMLYRLQRSLGVYRYNFVHFNCQQMCHWWLYGEERVWVECVARGFSLVPFLLVLTLILGVGIVTLYNIYLSSR